jgi:acetoacetate decarboxylase
MNSYFCPKEDVENFLNQPNMADQNGFVFAYESDLKALQKIVPSPLTVKRPIVLGHVMHVEKPTFCEPYDEASLSVLVEYKGQSGLYPITNLISGPGNQEGVIAPREMAGMPNKFTNSIWIRKTGDVGHCEIARHGVNIINLDLELGQANDSEFANIYAAANQNTPVELSRFFINYDLKQDAKGKFNFANTELTLSQTKNTVSEFVPGKIKLTLTSSVDDPVEDLPVIKELGGAWLHIDDAVIAKTTALAKVDPDSVAPYLITGHYDRAICESEDTFLTF